MNNKSEPIEFTLETEYIHLNQLLKLLGWVESGAEANAVILSRNVLVNGVVELRKRNKIYEGMTVNFAGNSVKLKEMNK